jgi:hypothetical protein
MRKPRSDRYKIKAKYIENNRERTFYCKENKMKNITNELGQSRPLSNGERILETDSEIDFKINHVVFIGGDRVLIQDSNETLLDTDLNARRGKPRYITTLLVR